uniref:Single domain-containing protein n=1 Tax=Amblyomma maculatum TaxID=34609 RepID=G3MNZ8_AMBMU
MKKVPMLLLIFGAEVAMATRFSMMRDESLHCQDGECFFRGYEVKVGVSVEMEKPCEEWDLQKSEQYPEVFVKGCDGKVVSERTLPKYIDQNETNVWPSCCQK